MVQSDYACQMRKLECHDEINNCITEQVSLEFTAIHSISGVSSELLRISTHNAQKTHGGSNHSVGLSISIIRVFVL